MGETPLMEAVWSPELCRVLLVSRADVQRTSNSNRTAADFAKSDPDILDLLLKGPPADAEFHGMPVAEKPGAEGESDMSSTNDAATPQQLYTSSSDTDQGGSGKESSPKLEPQHQQQQQQQQRARWTCCRCDEVNRADRVRCNNCGTIQDESLAAQNASANNGFTESRREVCFFGIVDAKYDRRKPPGQRLQILELGNGNQSRFSGAGEIVLTSYQRDYKLVNQLVRSALVDNKKMTHDVFVECGLGHLRPKQVCYQRLYRPNLAAEIAEQLQCSADVPVVLKLLNRCRGAGVMVVNVGQELDEMLRKLLCPPPDGALGELSLEVATASDPNSFEEQCWHWWSNECPVFVAERCEFSNPIHLNGKDYDATLRVGFVLARQPITWPDEERLSVQCLGGYWKLPAGSTESNADLRKRVVSKAASGTTPVSPEDLADAYGILQEALPAVFARERSDVSSTMQRYTASPLMFAFTVSRQAADKVRRELQDSKKAVRAGKETAVPTKSRLFEIVEEKLAGSIKICLEDFRDALSSQDLPMRAAASYLERHRGAVAAQAGNWDAAQAHFNRSLELHTWNATTEYLIGVCHLREHRYQQALDRFLRSLHLDPEFKAAYVNFGCAAMALGDWDAAILASMTGLSRHPKAHQCSYNLGVSLARQLARKLKAHVGGDTHELESMAEASALELRKARDQKEVAKTEWSQQDDKLLNALDSTIDGLAQGNPAWSLSSPLNWEVHGMRGWTLQNFRL